MSLVATDACLDCGRFVHTICHAGEPARLECDGTQHPHAGPDGDFVLKLGVFCRVIKRGEPGSIYTISEDFIEGLMRYADHKRVCTASLRPEPVSEMSKTRDTGARRRTLKGFGGSNDR